MKITLENRPVVCSYLYLRLKCSLGEPTLFNRVMNINDMAIALKSNSLHLRSKGTAICGLSTFNAVA